MSGDAPGREAISLLEARRIERFLSRSLAPWLSPGEGFRLSGQRDGDWLCLRWDLLGSGHNRSYCVECRVDLRAARLPLAAGRDLITDFLGQCFDAYLRSDRQPFSGPAWERVEFDGKALFIRGQEIDEAAERAAEAMLAGHGSPATPPSAAASGSQDRADAAPDGRVKR
jgi:hypothetical protein